MLIFGKRPEVVVHRRWDIPDYTKSFPLPKNRFEAINLYNKLGGRKPTRSADVIARMLRAFQRVRAILAPYTINPVQAVKVFNAFLLGTERVRRGQLHVSWGDSRRVGEALEALPDLEDYHIGGIDSSIQDVPIGDLLQDFLEVDPATNCRLEPGLLIRHASGTLYQEAHLEIYKGVPILFPEVLVRPEYRGPSRRDTHYTPPEFARVLVEQSFKILDVAGDLPKSLRILDPACGSGVFLQESLRYLEEIEYNGSVELVGMDNSDVSCTVAKFCLAIAKRDAGSGMEIHYSVEPPIDALVQNWPTVDLVLTNPPFVAWRKMSPAEQESTKVALGSLAVGHADKSMAFIWKSVQSLRPGGVCASILPSPLLESTRGLDWRTAIDKQAPPRVIGRFSGYSYFPNAMVEPGFIVLKKKILSRMDTGSLTFMLAADGAEETLFKATRSSWVEATEEFRFEIYSVGHSSLSPANWMPRSKRSADVLRKLREANMPMVGALFDVKQGALTGSNKYFLLKKSDFENLPISEQSYFRAAAGSSTIRECSIRREEFLFYPYGPDGLRITSEEQLTQSVPIYYELRLREYRERCERQGQLKPDWWGLIRPRSWQYNQRPKIVTSYFGDIGNFAFDVTGEYAVLQGYGWLWRGAEEAPEPEPHLQGLLFEDEDEDVFDEVKALPEFYDSPLPWAYVAIVNSPSFGSLLRLFCPSVQGGQFNLSRRFVEKIPIPDLSDENQFSADILRQLAALGRQLADGSGAEAEELVSLVNSVYGLEVDLAGNDKRGF
jgi:adenine-specific DNA-methyltransferase